MGKITPIIREMARLTVVDAVGRVYPVEVDITGPVIEAAKTLGWAASQIEKDGGKVKAVAFGTKQAGLFREEQRNHVPLIQGGFRRMSAFLRA